MTRVSVENSTPIYKVFSLPKWFLNQRSFGFSRWSSGFSHIKKEMTARSLPPLFDPCSCQNSFLLLSTLEDFLPPTLEPLPSIHHSTMMPFAHHLVYFPPPLPLSSLRRDGTDPLHSPRSPFSRQMWGGGKIDYSEYKLSLNGAPAFCLEHITDVTVRGHEGQEMVWVRIERRASHFEYHHVQLQPAESPLGIQRESLGQYLGEAKARDPLEVRNLVFLRDNSMQTAQPRIHPPRKIIKYTEAPDFSHTLIPSVALLFRFSALSYNAHAIHLDKHYCQEIEGHRNLLVHGPLTVILMVEVLRRHLANNYVRHEKPSDVAGMIEHIEYRNLAPLYAHEEMKVCGRKKGPDKYQMWIEGNDGGLAVRGLVKSKAADLSNEKDDPP